MAVGILLLLLGSVTVFYGLYIRRRPDSGWRMNEGWKVRGESEPSEVYLEAIKFTGMLAGWVGALFIVFGILLIWQAV
ncbi:DUF6199 family natural product biosynthesis protein [Paenibacillus tengchongensis]|uniref:DUF6199 family natural product biosynthesis protein n=1 Tax=Paenibacillus tengchongensis TaxID=2608684 RepID=UPI00124C8436|nr:DUF6199 family natural product biosynthesis protein [Paenibacillus tengchongensis]